MSYLVVKATVYFLWFLVNLWVSCRLCFLIAYKTMYGHNTKLLELLAYSIWVGWVVVVFL